MTENLYPQANGTEGTLRTKKNILKVMGLSLLNKQKAIGLQSGLSNEILCILVAQGAAKLSEVKV